MFTTVILFTFIPRHSTDIPSHPRRHPKCRQLQGDDKPATEPKPTSELGSVVIEYVSAPLDIDIEETEEGPTIDVELSKILERFGTVEQLLGKEPSSKAGGGAKGTSAVDLDNNKHDDTQDKDTKNDDNEDGELHLSKTEAEAPFTSQHCRTETGL